MTSVRSIGIPLAALFLSFSTAVCQDAQSGTYRVTNVRDNFLYTEGGLILRLARTCAVPLSRSTTARASLWQLVAQQSVNALIVQAWKGGADAEVSLIDGRNLSELAARVGAVELVGTPGRQFSASA